MQTFFNDDYRAYLALVGDFSRQNAVAVWAYCLMPNHVHLIVATSKADALAAALGEAHRRYTRRVNFRQKWRGYLWQGRFASVVMDEPHVLAAARYVERNPVRAGLVERPEDWPWPRVRGNRSRQRVGRAAGTHGGTASGRPCGDGREVLPGHWPR